jgi:hypothetical protein
VPEDALARYRLGLLLANTPETRVEAIAHIERARELAPWAAVLTVALGWMILPNDPLRVGSMLASTSARSVDELELRRQVALATRNEAELADLDAALEQVCGSVLHARVAAATEHLRSGRLGLAAQVQIDATPENATLEDALPWATVLARTGRGARVVEYLALHPELVEEPEFATLIAFEGAATRPEIVAHAARVVARKHDNPALARMCAVEALCIEGEFAAALAAAGDEPRALARLAEWSPELTDEVALAERAFALAPHDRLVAAAWHAALLASGRVEEAFAVARDIVHDFPFGHQGAERMAECESLVGDIDAAVAWAHTAVSEDPVCARALSAAAVASAAARDWDNAAHFMARHDAIARPTPGRVDTAPSRLVGAALSGDSARLAAVAAEIHAAAPELPIDRLLATCEARLS